MCEDSVSQIAEKRVEENAHLQPKSVIWRNMSAVFSLLYKHISTLKKHSWIFCLQDLDSYNRPTNIGGGGSTATGLGRQQCK